MGARSFLVSIAVMLAMAVSTRHVHAQASPDPATADAEARAREAFQRGRIHYDNGEFDQAAVAFEEAHSLSHRHALLYNLYLAYRDANQQEKAAEALRNYLDRVEVIENRPQLEARLKALEEGIAARRAAEAQKAQAGQESAPTTQATTPATQADTSDEPANPNWWVLPVAVGGAGAALMLGGIATGVMAKSKQKELDDKCSNGVCDPSLKSTADSGKTLALVTDVLLIGGGAALATGAVLLFIKKPEASEEPDASASVVCTPRLCGGSMAVRF
jgi:tetratricopeptide (TPR) repeat protein